MSVIGGSPLLEAGGESAVDAIDAREDLSDGDPRPDGSFAIDLTASRSRGVKAFMPRHIIDAC
jgi:hypothetical protein